MAMSPEEMAAMQQHLQEQGGQVPASQQMPDASPQEPDPAQLAEAERILGLDVVKQQLAQMQQGAMLEKISAKYPDVPMDKAMEELAKYEEKDPAMAANIRGSEAGLEMFFKGLNADVRPTAKPDAITDSGDNGGAEARDTIKERLDTGKKVTDVQLGEYILGS